MKKFFLLLCFAVSAGCSSEKEEKPAGLLPPEKMVSILADIHVAETQVETMALHPDTAKIVFNRLQKQIIAKHQLTDTTFKTSYNYYQNNLLQLDKIYEALVDTLGMREIKYGGNPQTPTPPDSLLK